MAEALGHRWGQIIGEVFESAMMELLVPLGERYGLYLDYKHARAARGGAKDVAWQDRHGNRHQLDYVFERGGTEESFGAPAAFIETAWRRYTKHSKNKAQEIDAAVSPLAETYGAFRPFIGAVLAGDFTENSRNQLTSRGFTLLYVPYGLIVEAFAQVGIDASFGETTGEEEFAAKIRAYQALGSHDIDKLKAKLLWEQPAVAAFIATLERSLGRSVERLVLLALHGEAVEMRSLDDAIDYITGYAEAGGIASAVSRYEITVHYSNGDTIEGAFEGRADAISFLRSLGPA